MLSDDEIAALSPADRADLIRRLSVGERAEPVSPGSRPPMAFLSLLSLAAVVLVGWLVVLGLTLPRTYVVSRWDSVWTGFDLFLLAAIVATAWAAWLRRQLLIAFSIVCATLVVCDAWFDVMTAAPGRDQRLSVASALLVELPFAALLILVARNLLRLTYRRMRDLSGVSGPDQRLYEVPLLGLEQ
jgi:hypothetical protein